MLKCLLSKSLLRKPHSLVTVGMVHLKRKSGDLYCYKGSTQVHVPVYELIKNNHRNQLVPWGRMLYSAEDYWVSNPDEAHWLSGCTSTLVGFGTKSNRCDHCSVSASWATCTDQSPSDSGQYSWWKSRENKMLSTVYHGFRSKFKQ